MSLNKWKAWPMEDSEVVLRIDKQLVTMKRGSCDQVLAKIKFSEHNKAGMNGSENFFWSILIYGTSNPSSYAKTRPVLRTDSELKD